MIKKDLRTWLTLDSYARAKNGAREILHLHFFLGEKPEAYTEVKCELVTPEDPE